MSIDIPALSFTITASRLMKNNAPTIFLVIALSASCMATAALAILHAHSVASIQILQMQVASVDRDRNAVLGLANETAEYSRRNPAVLPILDSLGLKVKPQVPAGLGGPGPRPQR
jgi:hypothetical protein